MNTDTGQIYRDIAEITAAEVRGEPLAMVSERVAKAVTIGTRQIDRRAKKKAAAKTARASRKRNRK